MRHSKYIRKIVAMTVLVCLNVSLLASNASAVKTSSGAKTFTFDDVNDSPLTLVANSNSHAINGVAYTSVYLRSYMNDTTHVYGVTAELCKNTYIRDDYTFTGWNLTRESDGKTLYFVTEQLEDGSTSTYAKWFLAGQQPANAEIALYQDCRRVNKLTTVQGDIVYCTAQWSAE